MDLDGVVNMDYRKLIGFSNGSFVVTVPKKWVQKNSLKKGDLIGIEESMEELTFRAQNTDSKKKEKIMSIGMEGKKLAHVKAEIVSAYLNNYSTIEIFSQTLQDDAPVVKGIIRNLSGMEIIEQTATRIVAKDLIDLNGISIQSIVRRMDVLARSMMQDTIACIDKECKPKSVTNQDYDLNRLYYLGFRAIKNLMDHPQLISKSNTSSWKLLIDRAVLTRLEEIADTQKRISRLIEETNFKDKELKQLKEIITHIKERFHKAMKSYYNTDKKLALEIETTNSEIIKNCNNFLEDASKSWSVSLKKSPKEANVISKNMLSAARVIEYVKASSIFTKHIARKVLSIDQ
ncbi:phosphate uptake regulator PhoU [Candidatus Woesearchaeota archaeon]|nr:phosphate uptake regulator PhoU [Candidatus Woesearchaeota archaeon]